VRAGKHVRSPCSPQPIRSTPEGDRPRVYGLPIECIQHPRRSSSYSRDRSGLRPQITRQRVPMRRVWPTAPCGRKSGKELMRPRKTILCVDDNEQTLSVRKFMLETRGYRVITASHGDAALELFCDGGVDLVLSDLAMPYMDGNELVRRMKSHSPDVPMILISGCIKDFDRADHADAFLPKGACTPLEMLERIRLLIARRRGPKKVGGVAAVAAYGLDPKSAERDQERRAEETRHAMAHAALEVVAV
jgi:two-component system, OmpR family, response regulator CpxR